MLKFSPMTNSDFIYNSYGAVESSSQFSKYESIESAIRGTHGIYSRDDLVDPNEISTKEDNLRQYLKLPFKVLNPILAGGGSSDILKNILDSSIEDEDKVTHKESVEEFIKLKKAYDTYTGLNITPINLDTMTYPRYRVGADALSEIVNTMTKEQINNLNLVALEKLETSLLTSIGTNRKASKGSFNREKKGLYFAGGFYYEPNERCANILNQEHIDAVLSRVYNSYKNGISIKHNLPDDLSTLKGIFMDTIMIPPIGMFPKIDERIDPIMKKYGKLMSRVEVVQRIIDTNGEIPLREFNEHYASIQFLVNSILLSGDPKKPNDKALSQKFLRGKYAFIRAKMLGKRVDYSGRAIITVNPELSMDQARLPKKMIKNLYQYHHIKKCVELGIRTPQQVIAMSADEAAAEIEELGILKEVGTMLNRAPTLHKLGFLGFEILVGDSDAIEIGVLVTKGYNADFDGDTMGGHTPIGKEAIKEVFDLMLPSKNLRHPANGDPILVPGMEMVYGMSKATSPYEGKGNYTYPNIQQLYRDVWDHKIHVGAMVTIRGKTEQAGWLAFDSLLPEYLRGRRETISSKVIKEYTNELIKGDTETYKKTVDNLVQFGFRMARLYSPTLTVTDTLKDNSFKRHLDKFYEDIAETSELYSVGLEDAVRFNEIYTQKLKENMDKLENEIPDILGSSNGFLQLVQTGARGSISNLQQIYALRGQIKKSDIESFTAVIQRGFAEQMHPLQHFISAYGSRKGLTDRSNKTAETGYTGRLMYQAASDWIITGEDCGTDKGFIIRKEELFRYIKGDNEVERNKAVRKTFVNIITGRTQLSTGKLITAEEAEKYADDKEVNEIIIRSPLFCKKPLCQKCYGRDLSTQQLPKLGVPVGFIAGHSIGEPGTQLTMRTFQSGGVAGKTDVTSNFDRMNNFLKVSGRIREASNYDPIAWATGRVTSKITSERLKEISIEGSNKKVKVPIEADIKVEAIKGLGLCTVPGDHYVREMLEYSTPQAAQRYLTYAMYMCYMNDASINFIHFEVLVASMSLYQILQSEDKYFLEGQSYSAQEYYTHKSDKLVRTKLTIHSVDNLPLYKSSPLSNILMENALYGLAKASILGLEDKLETTMGQLMMSVKPNLGTNFRKEN